MPILDVQREPTRRDLIAFGWLSVAFFGGLGAVVWWSSGSTAWAIAIWSVVLVVSALYCAVPNTRRPVYRTWMTIVAPIGWVISHLVLLLIYYGMMTPFGVVMRILGRDQMLREFDRDAGSYWDRHRGNAERDEYFKQF